MDDDKNKDTKSEEEEDAEEAEEEEESEEVDEEDEEDLDDAEPEEEEESEDDSKASLDDKDRDFDAEIEEEKKKGKPDPDKAAKAFKERKEKREGEDDKPLTRKEVDAMLAQDRKDRARDQALVIAKTLASSDKEAQLIIAKWDNRNFPADLTLEEQVTEMYAAVNHKRIIGQRNEAFRALKGKDGVNKNSATAHRDGQAPTSAPKMSPQDKEAYAKSGFIWVAKNKRHEKKLSNGDLLVKDAKTGSVRKISVGK